MNEFSYRDESTPEQEESETFNVPLPQAVINCLHHLRRLNPSQRQLVAQLLQDEKCFQRQCQEHHPILPPKKFYVQSDLTFEHMMLRVPALFMQYMRLRDIGKLTMVSRDITNTARLFFDMELARICHHQISETPPTVLECVQQQDYESLYAGLLNDRFGDLNVHVSDESRRCTGAVLHAAAIKRDLASCYLLLKVGHADPNVQDELGCTPLHYAARSGTKKLVQLLLDFSADVYILNNHARTVVEWAKIDGYEDEDLKHRKRASLDILIMAARGTPVPDRHSIQVEFADLVQLQQQHLNNPPPEILEETETEESGEGESQPSHVIQGAVLNPDQS